MASWCLNHLTITGAEQDVTAFREMAVGHSPWKKTEEPNPLNFHNLVPVPPEVLQAGDDEAGCRWECINWGCKWGGCEARGGLLSAERIVYRFDTPWAAPFVWLATVAKRFPTLSFDLIFREPKPGSQGMA